MARIDTYPRWQDPPSHAGNTLPRENPDYTGVDSTPPEDPSRRRKGDLGERMIPGFDSRPLSHGGKPFGNLKGGR